MAGGDARLARPDSEKIEVEERRDVCGCDVDLRCWFAGTEAVEDGGRDRDEEGQRAEEGEVLAGDVLEDLGQDWDVDADWFGQLRECVEEVVGCLRGITSS